MNKQPDRGRQNWLTIAKKLGHDVEKLSEQGGRISTQHTVNSLEELRELVQPGGGTAPRAGGAASGGGEPMTLDVAVQAYLAGAGELSAGQMALVQSAMPVTVLATTYDNYTIPANTDWNLGTSTTPQVININTLTMEPGSSISIYNTSLTLTVQTLIRQTS